MTPVCQLHFDRKLVIRRTQNNIPPNESLLITGHKNIDSLDNSSVISEKTDN